MISTLPLAFEVVLINRRPNGRRRFTALCTHNKITWNWLTIKAVFSNNPTSCIAFFADFPKGWRLISRNICQNQNHFFQINTAQHFFFFVKSSLLTTPAHAMFCSRFSSSQIPFVFDNIFSRNLFHFTTAHALYQFHEIFQNEFPFKTVFGMSEISWYYSLLFWLILEEEPNWKNFKTKSDATLIRDEITKPLTPF